MLKVLDEPENEILLKDILLTTEKEILSHHIIFVSSCDQFNIDKNDIFVLVEENESYLFRSICREESVDLDTGYDSAKECIKKAFEGKISGNIYLMNKSEMLDMAT